MDIEIIKHSGSCINIRKDDGEPEANSSKNEGERLRD